MALGLGTVPSRWNEVLGGGLLLGVGFRERFKLRFRFMIRVGVRVGVRCWV